MGMFITVDEGTKGKMRLDYGKVHIKTTTPELINRVLRVKINTGGIFNYNFGAFVL